MYRAHLIGMLLLLAGGSILIAQDDDKLKSGPKAGTMMPKPFPSFNVNGPNKNKPHCLICGFALNPAVVIFARLHADGKDEAFNDLITKLETACVDFDERSFAVGVVILSPDAHDSTNNPKIEKLEKAFKETILAIKGDLKKANDIKDDDERKKQMEKLMDQETKEYLKLSMELNEEAKKRKKLVESLEKRAEDLKLKRVIVSTYPEAGPPGYDLNPKAEITVLFYERMKVIENYSYGPGAMEGKQVDAMVKRIRETLPPKKKAAAEK